MEKIFEGIAKILKKMGETEMAIRAVRNYVSSKDAIFEGGVKEIAEEIRKRVGSRFSDDFILRVAQEVASEIVSEGEELPPGVVLEEAQTREDRFFERLFAKVGALLNSESFSESDIRRATQAVARSWKKTKGDLPEIAKDVIQEELMQRFPWLPKGKVKDVADAIFSGLYMIDMLSSNMERYPLIPQLISLAEEIYYKDADPEAKKEEFSEKAFALASEWKESVSLGLPKVSRSEIAKIVKEYFPDLDEMLQDDIIEVISEAYDEAQPEDFIYDIQEWADEDQVFRGEVEKFEKGFDVEGEFGED